jgi:competence protein ComEC
MLFAAPAGKTLDIYIVDTEGGKAALFVSPSGESLLIDAGNPGGRDTDRIMAAVTEAGLKQIDYLLLTHYHVDHVGGVLPLAEKIPIKHFVDHGPTVEEKEQVAGFQQAYAALYAKATHTIVKPGDKVPIAGLDWLIITAGGRVLKTPLSAGSPGAGAPNPACAASQPRENPSDPENGQSTGSLITFGKFRALDLGDLLWNNELDLMCPNNPIGTVDLYLVSHHGLDASNSPALVHGLQPRVAIMQNGQRKGAGIQTMKTLHTTPRLQDVWQLHWGFGAGLEHNSPSAFIANVEDPALVAALLTASPMMPNPAPAGGASAAPPPRPTPHTGPANEIKVSAREDGSFTVTNTRNGFSRSY